MSASTDLEMYRLAQENLASIASPRQPNKLCPPENDYMSYEMDRLDASCASEYAGTNQSPQHRKERGRRALRLFKTGWRALLSNTVSLT
jgi:hypothetical protein